MFTTPQQARQTALQQVTAFGLAAVITLGILVGVNGLATAPQPDSLLAAGAVPVALNKTATQL